MEMEEAQNLLFCPKKMRILVRQQPMEIVALKSEDVDKWSCCFLSTVELLFLDIAMWVQEAIQGILDSLNNNNKFSY